MTRLLRGPLAVALAATAAATVLGVPGPASAAPAGPAPAAPPPTRSAQVCADPAPGHVRCLAAVKPGSARRSAPGRSGAGPAGAGPADLPAGYGPADLASAYGLGGARNLGAGRTVAIVVAYDYPTAEADLAVYRETFGLPPCTAASGCFRKVNQQGAADPMPPGDPGWALEAALDLQAASAACPRCNLLLVQADDSYVDNMAAAVDAAVKLGATVVSNSYGTDEFGGMREFRPSYAHAGVPILAAAGNWGFTAAQFPAVFPTVIAVGGTTLTRTTGGRGWAEDAWWSGSSGCSAWIAKPRWQTDPNCRMRTTADVSAVADPETGLAVYDTYGLGADNGWLVVGGTSAATPFVAGVVALGPDPSRYGTARRFYARPGTLRDVVGGSNGYCGGDYLCTGLPGYDGPTGLGTPKGVVSVS